MASETFDMMFGKPIELHTEKYGLILLRPYLTSADILKLFDLGEIAPRDFVAKAVERFIYKPSFNVNEVITWDDDLLIKAARLWGNEKEGVKWDLNESIDVFSAFQQSYIAEVEESYLKMQESMRRAIAPTIAAAQRIAQQYQQMMQPILDTMIKMTDLYHKQTVAMAHLLDSVKVVFPAHELFVNLPDISQLIADYETHNALDEAGYGFMTYHWRRREVRKFYKVAQIDNKTRNAAITNKHLAFTRTPEFNAILGQAIQSSIILKRRWRIIEQALIAHQNRNYVLSIPVLLAQVEGMFTDALALKGIAVQVNGRLCEKDATGKPKLDKNGNSIPIHDLKQKVKKSNLQNEKVLQDLGQFYTSYLGDERNAILHGSHLKYDRAKLSVQLLLNIYLLAIEFVIYESSDK